MRNVRAFGGYNTTAIEYGLIAALIAVVAIAGMNLVGSALMAVLTRIANELRGAAA